MEMGDSSDGILINQKRFNGCLFNDRAQDMAEDRQAAGSRILGPRTRQECASLNMSFKYIISFKSWLSLQCEQSKQRTLNCNEAAA